MRTYKVFGDYGYVSENELFETNNLQEALNFARSYTRWGDMGGYNVIEVAWFTEDGEYVEELRIEAEEEWEYFSD